MSPIKVQDPRPPRLSEWVIRNLAWDEDRLTIQENLREEYLYIFENKGGLRADLWYWGHMVRSIVPFLKQTAFWRIIMLKNYLKIALRNFTKQKSFSIINISGLAIGMACCMLIVLWVQDELNYERFHENLDDIFLVANYLTNSPETLGGSVPAPLVPYLKNRYDDIKHAARFRESGRRLFSYEGNHAFEDSGGFADPELFDIFSYRSVLNDPKAALRDMNTIVLTERMAEKYFGSEDPLGKTIRLENSHVFAVGAVIEDIPGSSSIQFDYLIAFDNFGRFDQVEMDNWGRYESYQGFVILDENVDPEVFSEKIVNAIVLNYPESNFRLTLYPYKNIRLFGLNNDGTFKFVLIFAAIAAVILFIACINFVNLTTAQSGRKAKEIGLRKVIGANRSSIRRQVYSELAAIVAIAFVLAVVLVYLFLPRLNALSGKSLSLSLPENFGLLLAMLGIAFVTLLISGTYPAFYLSSFTPVKIMKSAAPTGSGSGLRRR